MHVNIELLLNGIKSGYLLRANFEGFKLKNHISFLCEQSK